ncbi:LCP family protein, partial [Actinomyces sp.]|uniref:LCP family protein n=1 Tax=Actinomyces sp. TaxID=29317 RepID=UPI00289E7888
TPPRDARPRRRRRRRWPRLLVLLLVVVLAWPAFLLWDANRNLGRTDALSSGTGTPGTTYLLAGSDSRADGAVQDGTEGQRADSIMLVNVAPNGQASATSLPRDTYVDIPGYGWNKLNASYSFGGAPLLVETVETLTGLHVDHFVEIGMGGVGNIVDAIGGVELCLDMDVNDAYSGLVWQSGCHEADGTTALAFSRMRYSDPLGDIGRAQRQRQVVEKTVSTAMSPSVLLNPVSAFRLERAGSGALTVDEDSDVIDIARLVLAFRSAGGASLTGAPPIESLGYGTAAGSVVLLEDQTAPDFFQKVREGTLTPADMEQSL